MPKLTQKESLPHNVLIATLLFLWGFSYGLIGILNIKFGMLLELSPWATRGLHAAYHGGYLLGGIFLGRLFLNKLGFADALIAGLYIYACGALLFWPSAVLGSLPTFIVSNMVVAFGLVVLETTANLFVAICGPLEYSEIRLCLAQSFQGMGNVSATELARRFLFKNAKDTTDVVNAQWTYLIIAFISVLLSVLFYYLPLPEAPNDDLRQLAAQRPENRAKVWNMRTCYFTMAMGIGSQFFYQAGQEAHFVNFTDYVKFTRPSANNVAIIEASMDAIVLYIGLIVVGALCMHTTGLAADAMTMIVFFFENCIFPTIFAMSMRGTAQHAKTAASLMAAAICGGTIGPFAQLAAAMSHGEPWFYSVATAFWSVGALFVIYLNFVPQAKRQVDPIRDDYIKEK
ncbi:conserved hypothetical protein [Talaromyces stipitatus ATCC 10500]|uniref:MFS transporter n=1 Tax=Talaromyces stipitatus (strain ATCC 10500 / CBS 375.48 / QM 6759 / NRRL 1006) TaxID=441959 RepID=B8MBC9_TALSN|nr:uncharacterized protein TSTA_126260 [Talaromyces stipitatus ATCC 10500]EED18918.1 conserved hypothetical protein [Talaromyces stipitatus ATCC 10500]